MNRLVVIAAVAVFVVAGFLTAPNDRSIQPVARK